MTVDSPRDQPAGKSSFLFWRSAFSPDAEIRRVLNPQISMMPARRCAPVCWRL